MITGVQVSSLKPVLMTESQVREAFLRLRDMGCTAVQLQWIDRAVPVRAIADSLREAGLASVSVQDFYETIRADKEYYISLNRETGGKWICVSRIPERLKTLPGLDMYISELRAFQNELDAYGQTLCLHPVSADFEPIEGVNPVEYLLENMPELAVCLDLYHINKRGFSMPDWIRKYASRICMVHFKDEKDGSLVPAGQGDTDWRGVTEACIEAKIPYAFVEQEKWDRDPFLCLKEALDWLNSRL
ncbi:MAG: TIM barrel protein [Clostridia bacterium]|nr:TIM barrel protein [Clostridia bacterium]